MKRLERVTFATTSAVLLVLVLGGAASAQAETIYETQFLDPAQAAAEWGFPTGEIGRAHV